MTTSMKTENKIEGASNYRTWKKRVTLVLAKHKVLDFVQGKVNKPTDDVGKEKYMVTNILAMNMIIDGVKDSLIPYIYDIDSAQEMYETLSKLFTIKNVGHITSLKNELRTIKMTKDDIVSSYFVRISRIRDELQVIDEFSMGTSLNESVIYHVCSWHTKKYP